MRPAPASSPPLRRPDSPVETPAAGGGQKRTPSAGGGPARTGGGRRRSRLIGGQTPAQVGGRPLLPTPGLQGMEGVFTCYRIVPLINSSIKNKYTKAGFKLCFKIFIPELSGGL